MQLKYVKHIVSDWQHKNIGIIFALSIKNKDKQS